MEKERVSVLETYSGVYTLNVVDGASLVGTCCGSYASALTVTSMVWARGSRYKGIAEAVVVPALSGESGAEGNR